MLRGIYAAAAGMNAVQTATDTLANNLANISTAGFKTRRVQYQAFPEMLMNRLDNGTPAEVGKLNTGVEIAATSVHFTQGTLKQTGNKLDIALEGDGLFEVQLPNGEKAYTRVGAFALDDQRTLVTVEGYPVLNDGDQPITLPQGIGDVTIYPDGGISTDKGENLGVIKRVKFQNPQQLENLGNSLFTTTETPTTLTGGEGGQIVQGYLEQSNTNVVSEMMQSMMGLRLYESLQKSISSQSQTLEKAVTEVGRI